MPRSEISGSQGTHMIRFKETMTNAFPRCLCNSYLCVVNESSVTPYLHFDIFTFKCYYTGWAIVDLSFIWWLVVSNIRFLFFFDQLDYLFMKYTLNFGHLPGSSDDLKKSSCNEGYHGSIPGLEKCTGEGKWVPTPVFLLREFHGQRNVVGCSWWACNRVAKSRIQLSSLSNTFTFTVSIFGPLFKN